jgi:hypothetical protein
MPLIVAALAQNDDGLRVDQAGAADDDDPRDSTSHVDDWKPAKMVFPAALRPYLRTGNKNTTVPANFEHKQ